MKPVTFRLWIIAFCLLLLLGCSSKEGLNTKAVSSRTSAVSSEHFVGLDQVLSYANDKRPLTKSGESGYSLDAYRNASGDTLLYIINFGNGEGWQILSSDSRTPAVIAEGYSGKFSLEEGSPALKVWLDCTASDIANIRNLPDEQLNFSADEIASNKAFWAEEHKVTMPRALDDPMLPSDDGLWIEDITATTEDYEVVGHLTPQWHDQWPYNAYCPTKTDGTGSNASAGCVAVAGAATLYYLHTLWGVPQTIVSMGSSPGNVDDPHMNFFNPTSTAWNEMSDTLRTSFPLAHAEAVLIGHVGKSVSTTYGNNGSYSTLNKLYHFFADTLGISCNMRNYKEDTVRKYIRQLSPIVVGATLENGAGHCFVIDGYKLTRTKFTHYVYFLPNDPDSNIWYPPFYYYCYSNPTLSHITINWGWENQWTAGINDGWFSLTANWSLNNGHYFTPDASIICGFHL